MSALNSIDLKLFKKDCNVFFETGTCFGDGVDYALKYFFDRLISVEIEDKKIPFLRNKYNNFNHVEIIHGTSLEAFKDKLPNIKSNILFWLDAHYPDLIYGQYADPTSEKYERVIRMPLEQELLFLKEHRKSFKDVIIMDDLDCFINNAEKMPDWLKPRAEFKKDFYKEIFKDTHTFIQIDIEQTIGVLLPN